MRVRACVGVSLELLKVEVERFFFPLPLIGWLSSFAEDLTCRTLRSRFHRGEKERKVPCACACVRPCVSEGSRLLVYTAAAGFSATNVAAVNEARMRALCKSAMNVSAGVGPLVSDIQRRPRSYQPASCSRSATYLLHLPITQTPSSASAGGAAEVAGPLIPFPLCVRLNQLVVNDSFL